MESLDSCRWISRQTFLDKILNNMRRCRWNIWIWSCMRDLSDDLLPETRDTSLCLSSVSKVFCCKNYYWVEFITRFHHLIGFGTILQKPAVCYIVPVGVHTPLPQYSIGVWQLSSRSRSRSRSRGNLLSISFSRINYGSVRVQQWIHHNAYMAVSTNFCKTVRTNISFIPSLFPGRSTIISPNKAKEPWKQHVHDTQRLHRSGRAL